MFADAFAGFRLAAHIAPAVTLGLIANGAEKYLRAEINYATTHEGAFHLDDILRAGRPHNRPEMQVVPAAGTTPSQ